MSRPIGIAICLAGALCGACAGPPVVATARGPFDTVSGVYGGNEFSPLSAEGKRTFAGDASDQAANPESAVAAPAPAAAGIAAPPVAVATASVTAPAVPVPASAPASVPAPVSAAATVPVPAPAPVTPSPVLASAAAPAPRSPEPAAIAIDTNAFGAVFGGAQSPLKPTAEQLMQLDSLSLITAEPLRTDLQKKLLACRRAGQSCRLAAH